MRGEEAFNCAEARGDLEAQVQPHSFIFCNSSNGLCECGEPRTHAVHLANPNGQASVKWRTRHQRDDLKRCPFCDTHAVEQWDGEVARIICGNPFCTMICYTHPSRILGNCEQAWQDRK